MSDLVTKEYVAAVLIRFAQAQSSDAATDDLTVPLVMELGAAKARIEALEAAGKRLADAAEHDVNSIGGKWSMNTESALAAWRAVEKGGGDE